MLAPLRMSTSRAEAFAALRFDTRLRGRGAQPHEDLAFSLAVRRAGWKVLYDPAVLLEHYAGWREEPRYYVGGTKLADSAGFFDNCFNNAVALWGSLTPVRRVAYAVWVLLVGTRVLPGLVQAVRMTPGEGGAAWRKLLLCQRAHLAAYSLLLRPARVSGGGRGDGASPREAASPPVTSASTPGKAASVASTSGCATNWVS